MNDTPTPQTERELQLERELNESKNTIATLTFELSIWHKADAVLDADPKSTDDPCYINIKRLIDERDQWRKCAEWLSDSLKDCMGHVYGEHHHWKIGFKALSRFNKLKGTK